MLFEAAVGNVGKRRSSLLVSTKKLCILFSPLAAKICGVLFSPLAAKKVGAYVFAACGQKCWGFCFGRKLWRLLFMQHETAGGNQPERALGLRLGFWVVSSLRYMVYIYIYVIHRWIIRYPPIPQPAYAYYTPAYFAIWGPTLDHSSAVGLDLSLGS